MFILKRVVICILTAASNLLLRYIGISRSLLPKTWEGVRPTLLKIIGVDYGAAFLLAETHQFSKLGVSDNIAKVINADIAEGPVTVTNPSLLQETLTYFWFPRRNYELANAVFDPRCGLVLINGMVVIESSHTFPNPNLQSANLVWRCRRVDKLDVTACSGIKWAYNYAHWLTEDLMSVLRIRKQFGDHVPFITPRILARFQVEALELLGVRRIETDYPVLCDKFLLAGQHQRSQASLRPTDISLLRSVFLPLAVGISQSRAVDLDIYVSRSKTKGERSFSDEEELERILADSGFLVVHTQDLEFSEEIALFAKAKTIVGITGSGLINHLWMPPGGKIVEIWITDYLDFSYLYSGPHLGLKYSLIDLRSEGGKTPAKKVWHKIRESLEEKSGVES